MNELFKIGIQDEENDIFLLISDADIMFACQDDEVLNEFMVLKKLEGKATDFLHEEQGEASNKFKQRFISTHKDKIDMDKLRVISVRNYKELIQTIEEKEEPHNENPNFSDKEKNKRKMRIKQKLNIHKLELQKLLKVCKKVDICQSVYEYNDKAPRGKIYIFDSREILGQENRTGNKKIEKANRLFDKLENNVKVSGISGLDYLLAHISFDDFYNIYPNHEFSRDIINLSFDRYLLEKEKIDFDKYKNLTQTNPEEYYKLLEKTKSVEINKAILNTAREYMKYVDIDQFIMICAYRIEQNLEKYDIDKASEKLSQNILKEISEYCKENRLGSKYNIKIIEEKEEKVIPFSFQNIENTLKRFNSGTYISNNKIEDLKLLVEENMLKLIDIPKSIYDIGITLEDEEKMAFLNDINFKFLTQKNGWNKQKIEQLANKQGISKFKTIKMLNDNKMISKGEIVEDYISGKIDETTMEEILEEIDFDEQINYDTLKKYNIEMKEKQDETSKDNYERYLKLCKKVTKERPENLEQFSSQLMDSLAEELDISKREEYIQNLEYYYKQGILKMESIMDWEDEGIVVRLLNDEIINAKQVKELIENQTIKEEKLAKIYSCCALNENLEYARRIKILKSGFVPANAIAKAYGLNLISEKDLNELIQLGYIDRENTELKKQTVAVCEKNANIVLGNIGNLRKMSKVSSSNTRRTSNNKNRSNKHSNIINPNAREDFIMDKLGFEKASVAVDKDSPFYNYEFYVKLDENGDVGIDSIVIAERYFKDKDKEGELAVNNATYFYKYKDLMFLSNLKKSEILKGSKGIVFTANHVAATKEKKGTWASSTLNSIAKTRVFIRL